MKLVLTPEETEHLGEALGVASLDELQTQEWHVALAGAVRRLLRVPTAVVLEVAGVVRTVGDVAAYALLADRSARADASASPPPKGVWSRLTRRPSAPGRPGGVVGMTAVARGGAIRVSVVSRTPPPPSSGGAGALEHCAALLGLLFPVFEATAARRSARDPGLVASAIRLLTPARSHPALRDVEAAATALRRRYRLTARETDVVRLLLRGRSNGDVAHALGISVHTARHHTERVFTKLDVRSRSALWPLALD